MIKLMKRIALGHLMLLPWQLATNQESHNLELVNQNNQSRCNRRRRHSNQLQLLPHHLKSLKRFRQRNENELIVDNVRVTSMMTSQLVVMTSQLASLQANNAMMTSQLPHNQQMMTSPHHQLNLHHLVTKWRRVTSSCYQVMKMRQMVVMINRWKYMKKIKMEKLKIMTSRGRLMKLLLRHQSLFNNNKQLQRGATCFQFHQFQI